MKERTVCKAGKIVELTNVEFLVLKNVYEYAGQSIYQRTDLQTIFEPFICEDVSINSSEGSGLGLAIRGK